MLKPGCNEKNFSHILHTREGAIAQHYPFNSVGQALAFLNLNNPARQRFPNLLEPEFGNCYHDDFSGQSPRDLWASVAAGVFTVLKDQPYLSRLIWVKRNRGDSSGQLAVEDIATEVGVTKNQVYRILKEVREELESELFRRGLLNPVSMDDYSQES